LWIEQNSCATFRQKLGPFEFFMLFFEHLFSIILEETNHCLYQDLAAWYRAGTSAMQNVKTEELLFPDPYSPDGL
jgi:hypothetical protein